MDIGLPPDLTWYKLLMDWGSLIGGSFALIAGIMLYIIGHVQAGAIRKQTDAQKRRDDRERARDVMVAARMLDASLLAIQDDIIVAKDSYHSPDNSHIIAKGDATPIRQSITKPGFPFLWEKIGVLNREIPPLVVTLEIGIDRLKAENEDTTFGGLMGKLDRLAGIVSSLRNFAAEDMKRANTVLSDPTS